MNKKNTKKALFASVLSLLACVALLAGTTFAWFTDSVSSANNKIVSGSLDVELWMYDAAQDKYVDISDSTEPIFGEGTAAVNSTETLWEPGKTQVAYLAIHNAGTLALKYQVALRVVDVANRLYEVMEYAITPDAQNGDVTAWNAAAAQSVNVGSNIVSDMDVALTAGATHYFALSVHMKEEAGNEYQNGQVNFDLTVLAGQLSYEEGAFGPDYDINAAYPVYGTAEVPVNDASATYFEVFDGASQDKIASFNFFPESIEDPSKTVDVLVKSVADDSTITIAADQKIQSFEVKVSNLAANNSTPVVVDLFIGENRANVVLYHNGVEIPCTYSASTGWIKFQTLSFSPFSVVYDAEPYVGGGSIILPPDGSQPEDMPVADVVENPELVGVALPWGSFGGFSPSNLDQQLEAAYTFSIPEGDYSKYNEWKCDFVVSMNRDVQPGALFLGGCYGDFGWVGFENPEFVAANTEIPLLGSVTELGWTYEAIDAFVNTFICGVAHLDDSLDGATFTVCLRLTNPDNEEQYFDVNTIRYTFPID